MALMITLQRLWPMNLLLMMLSGCVSFQRPIESVAVQIKPSQHVVLMRQILLMGPILLSHLELQHFK